MLNTLKKIILGLTILISTSAQAKLHEFEETFVGNLLNTQSFQLDSFTKQLTLFNGDISLRLYYDGNLLSGNYPEWGAFTRTESKGAFSGNFSAYYSLPDYGSTISPLVISSGFFDQDNRSLILPNTGPYQYSTAYGEVTGTVTEQGDVNLRINWTIRTPDVFSPVPEVETSSMLCLSLLMIGLRSGRKQH